MFFNIAYKINKRSGYVNNIIVIIQISIIMVISLVTVSSICSRYTYYNMYKDYFSSKNGFFWMSSGMINSEMTTILKSEELALEFPETSQVISCHNVWVSSDKGNMNYISYDREIINNFKPELESGKWLSENSENVQAVITKNNSGIKEGSKITLYPYNNEDKPIEVTVAGVLKEKASIPGFYSEMGEDVSFRNFYTNYDSEYEEAPGLIMSYDVLSHYEYLTQQLAYKGMITFDDSVSGERMQEIKHKLSQMNCSYICDIETIHKNSMAYIYDQVYILLPVITAVFILSCISIVSLSAVTVKQELKNYAVFAVCGLAWKKCVIINMLASLLLVIFSIILTVVFILSVFALGLSERMIFIFNGYTISALFFSAIIFICVSAIMPVILINRMTPKQIIARK